LRLLLDTCVFLWLCAEPKRLSAKARRALGEAEAEIVLSDVSVMEISLKWMSGKIALPAPPRSWVAEQTRIWSATLIPITRGIIYRSTELPSHHRDPFDRLLVSTALENSLPLLTPDEWLNRYPVECIW
jgi:PIN domain nuclease of toxin-antitoxin system